MGGVWRLLATLLCLLLSALLVEGRALQQKTIEVKTASAEPAQADPAAVTVLPSLRKKGHFFTGEDRKVEKAALQASVLGAPKLRRPHKRRKIFVMK